MKRRIWFHGTNRKQPPQVWNRPLYLTPGRSEAFMHATRFNARPGWMCAFTLKPQARWADMDKHPWVGGSMDSIGYQPKLWKGARKAGDVLHQPSDTVSSQVFVVNPEVLQPLKCIRVRPLHKVGDTIPAFYKRNQQ